MALSLNPLHPRLRRLWILACGIAFVTLTTGCDERDKLAKERDEISKETNENHVKSSEIQKQINQLNIDGNSLRNLPAMRQGAGAFEAKLAKLEAEVAALTEQKAAAEAKVASLRKDYEEFSAQK